MNVWILTREENDYNQYGEYFEAAFASKPTPEQLASITGRTWSQSEIDTGEGRDFLGDTRYNLREEVLK